MKKLLTLIMFQLQLADLNVLEYVTIFNDALDQLLLEESTSGWMDQNAGQVKYTGGNEVKVPIIDMDGLGDHARNGAYTLGGVNYRFQTFTMLQDRDRQFNLDKRDVDETNFGVVAGSVISQFARTKQIPEIDAYRYSKIFDYANGDVDRVSDYTALETSIWKELTNDISRIQDIVGESVQLVITMRIPIANILNNNTEIAKRLGVTEFTQGNVNTSVMSINGIPIKKVSTARMKTEYQFLDGKTGGQEKGGFVPTALAANINWIISAMQAPIGVSKIDELKIISPEVNQFGSGWSIMFRNFYDLWVLENKLDTLHVSYEGIEAPALTAVVAGGTAGGSTKFTATVDVGNTLAYSFTTTGEGANSANYNADSTDVTGLVSPYTSGADILAATATDWLNMYELNSLGQVQKFATFQLTAGEIT